MRYLRTAAMWGLLLLFAFPAWAAQPEPLLIVEYREDTQSSDQNRELTRVVEISLRVRLKPGPSPDVWRISAVEQDEIHGRQVFTQTSGGEVYVLKKVRPKKPDGDVVLWRDPLSRDVLAVSMPSITVDLIWQSPGGEEPPETLVVGPVSHRDGHFEDGKIPDPSENPALPDAEELPGWLKKKGVHPDFAVDSCPEDGVYAGGGAWLKEEPGNITEITYSWEFSQNP